MHAAGNAKVERANKTLMTSLKLLCTKQENWTEFIAPVLFSYRASVAIPLGMSPFQALFGRQMTLGIDLSLLNECETAPSTSAFVSDLASKMKITHDIVQSNMRDSALRSKSFYDVNTKTPEITVGAKVLLFDDTVKPCLLYTSPSPRDRTRSRMPSSA